MLNDNKTAVLLTSSAGSLRKLDRSIIHKGDSEFNFSNKVKKTEAFISIVTCQAQAM